MRSKVDTIRTPEGLLDEDKAAYLLVGPSSELFSYLQTSDIADAKITNPTDYSTFVEFMRVFYYSCASLKETI